MVHFENLKHFFSALKNALAYYKAAIVNVNSEVIGSAPGLSSSVARFFFIPKWEKYTRMGKIYHNGKNIPKDHKIYLVTI
jgi:hypothetical protein